MYFLKVPHLDVSFGEKKSDYSLLALISDKKLFNEAHLYASNTLMQSK